MGATWDLPGYDVQELVGFGSSGEVWRAVELRSGEDVALKRLHTTDAVARERLRREAAILSSVAGEHVVRVRDVVMTDAAAVLVMDFAPGGNLATVLAVRKQLAAPEVVTLVAPLADALADAHDRGIVHGDVAPANILFTAEGRPLLSDFGVARALGGAVIGAVEGTPPYLAPELRQGALPSAASDVWALCTIAAEAIDRTTAPHELLEAISRGLSDDPDSRVHARSLAGEVLRSCAAAPVGLVRAPVMRPPAVTQPVQVSAATKSEPPATSTRTTRRRRATRRAPKLPSLARPAAIVGAALAALCVAVVGGVAWGHHSSSAATMLTAPAQAPSSAEPASPVAPTPAPPAADPRPSWRVVVTALDAARSRAFTQADASLLDQVYAPRSRALALDRALLESIAARGLRALGLVQATEHVQAVVETPTDVTLRVTDVISAYRLVDANGHVVSHGAARPARTVTMELVRTAAGWRILNVSGD